MKTYTLVFLFCLSSLAQAETYVTPSGSYQVNSYGSTTYITQTSKSSGSTTGIIPTVPVSVNPVTGTGQVHTPQGSYLIQRSGSTTTVIQTSKGR
jgi:uncharacterized ion transporter superfamily protein YfcC